MRNIKYSKGFTLIELMIGMVIGLVLLTGAGGLFVTTLRINTSEVKQQQFEQTIQVLITLISSEIRKAGYAKPGVTLTAQANGDHYFASTSCVLLSHSTTAENERFYGYKVLNESVYMYSGVTNASCGSTTTGWVKVTDTSNIKIKQLWFDTGKVDLATPYDCSVSPTAGVGTIPRVTLRVEAVGLTLPNGDPVKRCEQVNVLRRNS